MGVILLWVSGFLTCLCPAMHKLLLVLALGVLLSEMRLASEARTPPYGVKLCGREFIRAVIFTCGGSRWRRAGEHLGHWGLLREEEWGLANIIKVEAVRN